MASILGSGTYGSVKKDPENVNLAIKTIHFKNIQSAIREITILKSVSHPNIIGIHKVKLNYRIPQFELYIDRYKRDLQSYRDEFWSRKNPNKAKQIEIATLNELLQQIFAGLEYLHKSGIMHRDLTPSNVLIKLTDDTKRFQVALCDFGLASIRIHEAQNKFYTTVCTVTYRAPEIYTGLFSHPYDEKIDIWSLGCIIFFLYTGEDMLIYNDYQTIFAHKRHESSRYLCHFFGLPDYQNHLTRLKALKQIRAEKLEQVYRDLAKRSVIHESVSDHWFNPMLDALQPNPNKRLSITELAVKYPWLSKYSSMNISEYRKSFTLLDTKQAPSTASSSSTSYASSAIDFIDKLPIDAYRNIEKRLLYDLSSLTIGDEQLATTFGTPVWDVAIGYYNRFLEQKPDETFEVCFLGFLYIASLILEMDEEKYEALFMECTMTSPLEMSTMITYLFTSFF